MNSFEEYLSAIKELRTKNNLSYTDIQFTEHIEYLIECYKNNIEPLRVLEFFYFQINRN